MATNARKMLSFWRCGGLGLSTEIQKRRRSRCVVCLQVHKIVSLPSSMDGRAVVVGWRTKWWKGEQTLPVHVCQGIANFEEIFLHCGNADVSSISKSVIVWVSLVDAVDCDLGTFHVDLSELAIVENSNLEFGGKAFSFDLAGAAHGGALKLSLFCRIVEEDGEVEEAFELEGNDQYFIVTSLSPI